MDGSKMRMRLIIFAVVGACLVALAGAFDRPTDLDRPVFQDAPDDAIGRMFDERRDEARAWNEWRTTAEQLFSDAREAERAERERLAALCRQDAQWACAGLAGREAASARRKDAYLDARIAQQEWEHQRRAGEAARRARYVDAAAAIELCRAWYIERGYSPDIAYSNCK